MQWQICYAGLFHIIIMAGNIKNIRG